MTKFHNPVLNESRSGVNGTRAPIEGRIVFLCGSLRSGTTMLRILLQNHGDVGGKGEFDFLFDPLGTDGGLDRSIAMPVDSYFSRLRNNRNFLQQKLVSRGETVPQTMRLLAEECRRNHPILLLTIHRNFSSAYEHFPEAQFIHLLRDPRDCALSAIEMGWSGNTYFGVDPWLQAETSWQTLKQQLGPVQACEVRYEDLFSEPENELRRLAAFMEVDYRSKMIETPHPTYGTPNSRSVQAWRKKASDEDIRFVELRAGQLMEESGYKKEYKTLTPATRLEKIGLQLENRYSRYRHEISRFGLPLWIAMKASSKVPLGQFGDHIQRRINQIVECHLR